jgi:hypothetical protein
MVLQFPFRVMRRGLLAQRAFAAATCLQDGRAGELTGACCAIAVSVAKKRRRDHEVLHHGVPPTEFGDVLTRRSIAISEFLSGV